MEDDFYEEAEAEIERMMTDGSVPHLTRTCSPYDDDIREVEVDQKLAEERIRNSRPYPPDLDEKKAWEVQLEAAKCLGDLTSLLEIEDPLTREDFRVTTKALKAYLDSKAHWRFCVLLAEIRHRSRAAEES